METVLSIVGAATGVIAVIISAVSLYWSRREIIQNTPKLKVSADVVAYRKQGIGKAKLMLNVIVVNRGHRSAQLFAFGMYYSDKPITKSPLYYLDRKTEQQIGMMGYRCMDGEKKYSLIGPYERRSFTSIIPYELIERSGSRGWAYLMDGLGDYHLAEFDPSSARQAYEEDHPSPPSLYGSRDENSEPSHLPPGWHQRISSGNKNRYEAVYEPNSMSTPPLEEGRND